ncbi:hypothetical protein OIU77_000930 [Salix suchowensis]|uniref:Trehalose 6-phosphate phosphatase n=1 Tax=Salix suchowensis TaxID=1278906 RepID=A0ABQ9B8G9_9ROSI|nr:hypothetical protein OIU77_000930 [Salix suchowensis]
MGFQRSSNRQKEQPGISDVSSNERAPNSCQGAVSDDANYSSWMVEHPSALTSFDQMMKDAKGKKIVVFLDYDGTLSPIVNDPDRAFMSDEMRASVREVAKYFPTAIISGRSRDKVKGFVQLSNIYYAGSHGMDIMAPPRPARSSDGKYHTVSLDRKSNEAVFQPAQTFLPSIQKILKELEEAIMKIQGARDYGMLEEKVKSIMKHYPDFGLGWGKKVMEIRPSIEWNKGNALEYLLDTLALGNCTDVLPVYIGDDQTDEDAFKVIRKRGQGYPIVVASSPKDTKASYSLHDPSEVLAFLLRLARWRKASSSSRSLSQIWGVGS